MSTAKWIDVNICKKFFHGMTYWTRHEGYEQEAKCQVGSGEVWFLMSDGKTGKQKECMVSEIYTIEGL